MNVERMNALADKLNALPQHDYENMFDIGEWGSYRFIHTQDSFQEMRQNTISCDTPGCVAGWAFVLFANDRQINDHFDKHYEISDIAQKILDLTPTQANRLFLGYRMIAEYDYGDRVTPQDAARVVRYMIQHPNDPRAWELA